MKIKVDENFTSLMNYINDYEKEISWFELVQYCIDYAMYETLYKHYFIFDRLINEHNKAIRDHTWVRPK